MRVTEGFKERAMSPPCWYDKHGECVLFDGCACPCHSIESHKLSSKRYIGG